MSRKVFFISALLIFYLIVPGVGCTHKSVPVITSRTPEPMKKEKPGLAITPDLNMGKIIFTTSCGKCHDLPLPGQFSAKRWEGILSYMIPRAKLNDEQGIHVTAYLKANAAK